MDRGYGGHGGAAWLEAGQAYGSVLEVDGRSYDLG
jgi:hypothetical protein